MGPKIGPVLEGLFQGSSRAGPYPSYLVYVSRDLGPGGWAPGPGLKIGLSGGLKKGPFLGVSRIAQKAEITCMTV